jgi:hypothetical protein
LGIPVTKRVLTCGAIALGLYTTKWGSLNLKLPKWVKSVAEEAHLGGRCEVYGNPLPGEKILHFDFAGMYQQCMEETLPYGDFKDQVADLDIAVPGFYYAQVEYYTDYPVLPIKEDKLYFKNGTIAGWYWHEELLLLLKVCQVKTFRLTRGLISQKNGPVLKDFIGVLKELRKMGDLKKQIGKLLINSFYGRLGLGDNMEVIQPITSLEPSAPYGIFGEIYLTKKTLVRTPRANKAVAAAIAAKGRIKLYEAQQEVLAHGGRLLYSDTDSVFAAFKVEAAVEGKLLGQHVTFNVGSPHTQIRDAVFICSKTYGLTLADGTEILKIKGVNVKGLTFSNLKTAFYSGAPTIELTATHLTKRDLVLKQTLKPQAIELQAYNKRQWSVDRAHTLALTKTWVHHNNGNNL